MRIGILAPPWLPVPPPGYGGTEAIVDALARGFQADGHEVLLWTTGDSSCPVPRGHVLPEAATDRIGEAVVELRHLIHGYDALREWGADIVHDHTVVGPVYALRFPGLPVVTTNHGPFNEGLVDLYRAVTPAIHLVSISRDQAARARHVNITRVIHHGIDLAGYAFGEGDGDEQGEYFLFLGRMAPEKGAWQAAQAARKAGARLLIAAKMRDATERSFYSEIVEPLLDERVVYLGEVANDEKIGLLRGARALVNPIRWAEPFGLVMVEALACGTPVLAFPEGSAPELIDHGVTGFLCDEVDDLVSAMPETASLDRRACRSSAEERFSIERMVREHLSLFETIIGER